MVISQVIDSKTVIVVQTKTAPDANPQVNPMENKAIAAVMVRAMIEGMVKEMAERAAEMDAATPTLRVSRLRKDAGVRSFCSVLKDL